jgi:hypothetical protein
MANELRQTQNFIGGLVEDNPLTSGATTLTSAGLVAITGGVPSTHHMPIVLDPDGLDGAPEISTNRRVYTRVFNVGRSIYALDTGRHIDPRVDGRGL